MSNHNFKEILNEIGDLHNKKNKDYGIDTDPYANIRGSADWGIPSWKGAMVRANDKIKRLQKFAQTGELANESVEDSFKDLAVYSLIALDLYRQEQAEIRATPTYVESLDSTVTFKAIDARRFEEYPIGVMQTHSDPGDEARAFTEYEVDLANGVSSRYNYHEGKRGMRKAWADPHP